MQVLLNPQMLITAELITTNFATCVSVFYALSIVAEGRQAALEVEFKINV